MSTENAVGCLFLSLTPTFYCFHKFAEPRVALCSKTAKLDFSWEQLWISFDFGILLNIVNWLIFKMAVAMFPSVLHTNTQIHKYSLGADMPIGAPESSVY